MQYQLSKRTVSVGNDVVSCVNSGVAKVNKKGSEDNSDNNYYLSSLPHSHDETDVDKDEDDIKILAHHDLFSDHNKKK